MSSVVSNWNVYGFDESVKASKYPMSVDISKLNDDITPRVIGLAQSKKGEGHDNFLNGIVVQFDLTFTVKAWTEAERYHFLDFVSSQSTMHKITKFDLDKAYIRYVHPTMITQMKRLVEWYNQCVEHKGDWSWFEDNWIDIEDDEDYKHYMNELYLEILYSNPCGMKLTARMTTNYRQLKTIYAQRKTHRLPEWLEFCAWIKTLPHSELITGEE
jgi:hypothetical protein